MSWCWLFCFLQVVVAVLAGGVAAGAALVEAGEAAALADAVRHTGTLDWKIFAKTRAA
jgi:hypothetical protein